MFPVSLFLLGACTGGPVGDSTADAPAAASLVYDGPLPDCALGFPAQVLCARGGTVPGHAATTAQVNHVPDWFWRREEPGVVLFASTDTNTPCADDTETATSLLLAERPADAAFVTGTDERDPRWIDLLMYGEGASAIRYRVPRCTIFAEFARLDRLRFADGEDLDPAWTLVSPPGDTDAAREVALYDAFDLARIIESHRPTIAQAGTDQTLLYAVGTSVDGNSAQYRTCRVDGIGYISAGGWAHAVLQVEYNVDLAAGSVSLAQTPVGVAVCDEPLAYGVN